MKAKIILVALVFWIFSFQSVFAATSGIDSGDASAEDNSHSDEDKGEKKAKIGGERFSKCNTCDWQNPKIDPKEKRKEFFDHRASHQTLLPSKKR